MVASSIEERFHILANLVIGYGVSLPFLVKDEERLFSFSRKKIDGVQYLVIHDLYILDRKKGEVITHKIEDNSRICEKFREGLLAEAALAEERHYMDVYENLLRDTSNYESLIIELRDSFSKLITDKALVDAYKFFGDEWVD